MASVIAILPGILMALYELPSVLLSGRDRDTETRDYFTLVHK